ncbi:MAG: hypothetical protein JXR36_04210 [Bacteroidales bacterium]|nr:hypothetical protein [Bacteroidales bacterium]
MLIFIPVLTYSQDIIGGRTKSIIDVITNNNVCNNQRKQKRIINRIERNIAKLRAMGVPYGVDSIVYKETTVTDTIIDPHSELLLDLLIECDSDYKAVIRLNKEIKAENIDLQLKMDSLGHVVIYAYVPADTIYTKCLNITRTEHKTNTVFTQMKRSQFDSFIRFSGFILWGLLLLILLYFIFVKKR